ncbi:MAG: glutaredoxin [Pseudomonadales bacterium]|jgi:glutathione S-transferase|nr:glutaredoxin [Pseudomonadales bacterium]MDP6471095.1 glutaredoxin [Pseudomonadales bacterium]MDP6973175.1 glutaredoxin [Pseudomonadales bacterium]|tara:strand:+ start:5056 stop:5331 length:276 start_codon:yes stop_codon:yes gene_type:complete
MERYHLYMYRGCGFCARVQRFLQELGIEMPLRDILTDHGALHELIEGGGRQTVPCLRIEDAGDGVRWMYESADIMRYLAETRDEAPDAARV